ncbi:rhodanese-like domain-containing protein [Clostridium botulinum]|uniref:rhodanese-like domain-containing protein n=1 Tax=Clostridium botulinum TaxID=1491 RepID=UPI0022468BCA|nr:rhodanese-like domain-containing protein [Clostridium botulinum]UZP02058.1 rhodanese-like domain-containing protein [Clostridium botulinum]UZP05417.1 rhodanese-like domain-containing protein [Clostridium botulinum]UZP08798.1 rhodanese-like domain-containing protein [Clostridium botulinum]
MFGFLKRDNGKVINVNDIDDLIGKVELIDIREDYEYKNGSIKSAKNIPMGMLLNEPNKYLNKDKEYYIMCQSGGRSARTCSSLRKQGYDVINVSGGVDSYIGSKKR